VEVVETTTGTSVHILYSSKLFGLVCHNTEEYDITVTSVGVLLPLEKMRQALHDLTDAGMEDEEETKNLTVGFFYERRVPDTDELVMVRVTSIDDVGVLCNLLEYNNLEGFLPLSEISRKRMRSVLRHVRTGQKQVLQVLRVDPERGFVDLSKKYITDVEREAGSAKYNNGKTVHSITSYVAEITHREVDDIYKKYVWPLYDSEYTHPFDAFKAFAADGDPIWKDIENPDPELLEAFEKVVKQRMATQPVKIGAQIEVTCYSEAGIEDIKQALKAGQALSKDVKIQLISSPLYLLFTTTVDESRGEELVNSVIDVIHKDISTKTGNCKVVKQPCVIGKVDSV